MDWDKIRPELQKKLDPKHIKPAPRGKYGEYVDGYHVISEANRIFGEDGWSYEITRLQMVSEQTVTTDKGPQYRVGYLCTVKVYVNGSSFKEGSAVGSGVGSPNTIADHHESAIKEAETDALKRALRSYGNTFGLALYDKEKGNIGVDPPPFNAIEARDRIVKALTAAQTADDLRNILNLHQADLTRMKEQDPPKRLECDAAYREAAARIKAATQEQAA